MTSTDRLLVVLFTLSMGYNGYMWLDHARGKSPAQDLQPGEARVVGTTPSPLSLRDRQTGDSVTLTPNGQPTLVYFLSPSCIWCAANEANVVHMWDQLKANHRFIGVSMSREGLDEFLAKHPVPFKVYLGTDISISAFEAHGLGATPNLMLFDGKGTIQKVWAGALRRAHQKSVEQFFGITLPGIR